MADQSPLFRFDTAPGIEGPFSVNTSLLGSGATSAPTEGIWVPWMWAKAGCVEVNGTFSTLSLQLYGTNRYSPTNSITVTLSGTTAVSDTDTLTFASANFTTGTIPASVVSSSTSLTTLAAQLAAQINATQNLTMWGITASSASAVITISWSSLPPVQPTGFYSGTTQPNVNNFTVIGASSGSTLFTPANVADGVALGSAITTSSIVTISQSVRWLKARVNTLTGGYVTANAQGNG